MEAFVNPDLFHSLNLTFSDGFVAGFIVSGLICIFLIR